MGKSRLALKMSVETCLRHLLCLVIPNARDSCFHYEGPECPIHSTQKALPSIQPRRPTLVMPGQCRQGTPESDSFYFTGMNMAGVLGPRALSGGDGSFLEGLRHISGKQRLILQMVKLCPCLFIQISTSSFHGNAKILSCQEKRK